MLAFSSALMWGMRLHGIQPWGVELQCSTCQAPLLKQVALIC